MQAQLKRLIDEGSTGVRKGCEEEKKKKREKIRMTLQHPPPPPQESTRLCKNIEVETHDKSAWKDVLNTGNLEFTVELYVSNRMGR